MLLQYENLLEDSQAILTDFTHSDSHCLLDKPDLYKIIWAMKDVQYMNIDGYKFSLNKEEVIFCTPLNFLDIPTNQEGLEGIVFNREFYCIRDNDEEVSCNGFLFYGSSQPIVIKLSEHNKDIFQGIFDIAKEEFKINDPFQGEMLRAILKQIIIKSNRLAKKEMVEPNLSQAKVDVIRQFNLLVEKQFKTLHQVSEYAEILCKSPKTLSNLFSKYHNKTPLTTINERILLEARRLLLFSNKTVEEIGYELGYKDAGHFSKFFKKHKGSSPLMFKKNTLNASN